MFKINPNLKEFLEKNEEKSLISFAWSCYWRITVVIYVIAVAIAFFVEFMRGFFS